MRNWKDGELSYCRELVYKKGDAKVPESCVLAYLTLQHSCAITDKCTARDAQITLQNLIRQWRETHDE